MDSQITFFSDYIFSWTSIPPLLVMIAAFMLGGWVIGRERGSRVSIVFALFPLSIGMWLFAHVILYSAVTREAATHWARASLLGVPFMPATLYLFTTHVLSVYARRKYFVWLIGALAVGFALLGTTTEAIVSGLETYWWGYSPVKNGWLSIPFLVYFMGTVVASFVEFGWAYRRAETDIETKRIRSLLVALAVACLGIIDFLPDFGIPVYPIGYLPVLAFLILTARAIRRYHLVDYNPSFAADQIVTTIADPVLICDRSGTIQFANPATEKTFGYAADDLQGSDLSVLAGEQLSPGDLTRYIWDEVDDREVLLHSIDETPIEVSLSSSRLENRSGDKVGAVVRARDIRSAKKADRLEEIDRRKSQFFANISHEFRTPLTLIIEPIAQALKNAYGRIEDPLRGQLRRAHSNARRLLRLVNQLLDLAKHQAGEMDLNVTPGDLISHLRERVHGFIPLADHKAIDLQFKAESDQLYVKFDEEKLDKILSNLLSNALKFTPEGGTVTTRVSVSEAANEIALSVEDTGPGIPDEVLDTLFERFHRGNDSHWTSGHTGAGIGLTVVKELTEAHGGTVDVETRRGSGSTFTVRLPRIPADPPTARSTEDETRDYTTATNRSAHLPESVVETPQQEDSDGTANASETHGGAEAHILVVEDNDEMRDFLCDALQPKYAVSRASDGHEGLDATRRQTPDLIVSDVMMPEMDGYDLCNELKDDENLRHIPIILLTARAADNDTVHGLAAGANDYLRKPFHLNELEARIDSLLHLRRAMRREFAGESPFLLDDIDTSSEDERFLERVTEVVQEQFDNSRFGVEDLAYEIGLSPRHLRRRMKETIGETPNQFLRQVRLERAAQLLEQDAGSISQIAYNVGFRSPSHFSTAFRKVYDTPPSKYAGQ